MALPQFEAMRRKIQGGAGVQSQESENKLKRAFARQGGIGGGEFVKQLQVSRANDAARRDEALQNVDFAEQQQLQEEEKQNKLLTRQEQEAERNRQFQGSEAEKARSAQESQFARQLGLTREQFDAQKDQFSKQFGLQEKSTLSQIDLQEKQFQQDQRDQFFNRLKSTLETGDRATREHLLEFEQNVFGDLGDAGIKGYGGTKPATTAAPNTKKTPSYTFGQSPFLTSLVTSRRR